MSKQEKIFRVKREVACRSVTVKNIIENTGTDTHVPLPLVDSVILAKVCALTWTNHASTRTIRTARRYFSQVIEYCEYHHRSEKDESDTEYDRNASLHLAPAPQCPGELRQVALCIIMHN